MGLKDHLKLKAFRLKRFLLGNGQKKRTANVAEKASWMMPISHGYHIVEDQSFKGGEAESDSDSVVVQREQIEELELWFFGISDAQIGNGVTKYLQSHLFDKNPKEIRRKSKEMMRKAYLAAIAEIRETQKSDETWKACSASVMVFNREKLLTANMGDFRVVMCRDGVAHQMKSKHRQTAKRLWSPISGLVFSWKSSDAAGTRQSKGSEVLVGAERIDSDTEFVIIGSTGIWEAMNNQEAVNLIGHLEDPQEAAECLAKEALTRMSKTNISCIVIRFD
ncbi:PROTEIN PHOSPHATASE 2C-LIKE PROTEIN 44-RELATED [Salix viminalis]|uniref:PROTEIN PHOSPHATASE 2C-LIKE PROTEIN 44-RELATED n=1 Tax=Salix viminalis TaxID=40686 RepID=A0A9Q0U1N0_SALVM|nr:PROTEIN PHOSPHATASE 2C-LIKE PROTEIN 44-RELATED [Salix viminalis]